MSGLNFSIPAEDQPAQRLHIRTVASEAKIVSSRLRELTRRLDEIRANAIEELMLAPPGQSELQSFALAVTRLVTSLEAHIEPFSEAADAIRDQALHDSSDITQAIGGSLSCRQG